MDRFEAMPVFTRIVKRRSFTKAVEDLGLPRSSIDVRHPKAERPLPADCVL
jgi:DNA-binding transcriptional LysR family regulator